MVRAEFAFDWDAANAGHVARHGVSPEEAEEAFLNEAVEIDYQFVTRKSGLWRWARRAAAGFW